MILCYNIPSFRPTYGEAFVQKKMYGSLKFRLQIWGNRVEIY